MLSDYFILFFALTVAALLGLEAHWRLHQPRGAQLSSRLRWHALRGVSLGWALGLAIALVHYEPPIPLKLSLEPATQSAAQPDCPSNTET